MGKWRFTERRKGVKERNSPLDQFFNLDVLDDAGESLVREGIQNSLDAGDGPVRIRIYLSGESGALGAEQMRPFLRGLAPHLAAKKNGLKAAPQSGEACSFLVFEDFGTTGLTGDYTRDYAVEEPPDENVFYAFFRAEGASPKEPGKLGRFGIGKIAFPLSSRGRMIFALTRRSDGVELMAGSATLKCHMRDGKSYQPDGWFGNFDDEGFQLPTLDPTELAAFRATFRLKRDEEPGLSVVVPYYDPRQLVAADVVRSVIRHFFLPVLEKRLSVEVVTPDTQRLVDDKSVHSVIDWLKQQAGDDAKRLKELHDLCAVIALARVAVSEQEPDVGVPAPPTNGKLRWVYSLEPARREGLARALKDGRILVAKFHLHVLRKDSDPLPAQLVAFIQEDPAGNHSRPTFVRNGNVIAAVVNRLPKGHRALISVPPGPLCDALGLAENPAHTEWRSNQEDFKTQHKYHASHIDYVVKSASNLLREIHATDEDVDLNALADLFPDFNAESKGLGKKPKVGKKGKRKKTKKLIGDPPPPKPKRYRMARIDGGFSIHRGAPETGIPARLTVKTAYALRRGNPLSKFHPADFDFSKGPIKIEAQNAEVSVTSANSLSVTEMKDDFSITVKGFDARRDLFVDVRASD